jgi:hypothetical protein
MSYTEQFNKLNEILAGEDFPYSVDTPFRKAIRGAIENSGFTEPILIAKKQPKKDVKASKKGKKLSGYNLFISAAMKGEYTGEKQSMADAVALWKGFDEDTKAEWKLKANEVNSQSDNSVSLVKDKKQRKPSGYNLFTKAKMAELKEDSDILPKDRLSKIGQMWKGLNQEERDEWNKQAKEQ